VFTKEQIEAIILRGRQDPVWFIHTILRVPIVTPQQRTLCRSVLLHRRTAAPSGHGIGKTFISACLVLWFLYCFPGSKILTTAPTWFQVATLLWREIRTIRSHSGMTVGKMPPTAAYLEVDTDWFAVGLSTNDPTRFQGVHAPYVMIVFDEATGVMPDIWDAAEGVAIGENDRMLAIGNPTDAGSNFKLVCDSHLWNKVVLSSEDHPNVIAGRTLIPGAVTRGWIADRLEDYGDRESPLFRARVRGLFPEQGDDMLISLKDVERSQQRWRERWGTVEAFDRWRADNPQLVPAARGVDVARFGSDDTVFTDLYAIPDMPLAAGPLKARHGQDTMATVGDILAGGVSPTAVDDSGLGGGVTDRLNEIRDEQAFPEEFMRIEPIIAGERALDFDRFQNRRAEMGWLIRDELQNNRLDLPPDHKLVGELTNIKYGHDSRGRIKLEAKDEVKKRIRRSPDRMDSLGLALAGYYKPVVELEEPAGTHSSYKF